MPDRQLGQHASSFLTGGGELARLIAAYDWSRSLGPIETWPESLRTTVGLLLHSPVPLVLLWGSDGIMLYNDAYAGFAGNRHPGLLGSKVLEGWPEAAELNAKVMAVGMAGGTLQYKDMEIALNRRGVPEPTFMDLFYSPVIAENGKPGGVIAVVVETTERVLAQRSVVAQNQRLAQMFQNAPSFMCFMQGPEHRFTFTNAAYQQLIAHRDVIGKTIREALPEIADQGFYELLDTVYATGEPYRAHAAPATLQRAPDAPPETRLLDFINQPVRDASGEVIGIFTEGVDVTESKRNEQHLELVINELNHRVKNNLAMIQSIASQTFRNATDLAQAHRSFEQRIKALSHANDLLVGNGGAQTSIAGIVRQTLQPLWTDQPTRLQIDGDTLTISPKTGLSLALALHELGTNALKYGAWSNTDGVVRIAWGRSRDRFHLEWRESGGPPVVPPKSQGFGSKLIERGLAAELGGSVKLLFQPGGLVCQVDAPFDIYGEG